MKITCKGIATACAVLILTSCMKKTTVDAIYFNAKIYTVNSSFSIAEAMAVSSGKIIEVGSEKELLAKYSTEKKIDLEGKFVYPGFIDAHCHFFGYGQTLAQVNLVGMKSWETCLEKVRMWVSKHPDGWITGRGWDQNDWESQLYPTKEKLDELFPERPVYLTRIDGHACIVNQAALDLAGINENTRIAGSEIISADGKLTGVLIDNAKDSIEILIPQMTEQQIANALLEVQQDCFSVGLTTVSDAGWTEQVVDVIDVMQRLNETGELKMRIYAMLTDHDFNREKYFQSGPIKTDRLNVRAFKFYADGALGSRGALLLEQYSDSANWKGLQLRPTAYYEEQAQLCLQHGFQMCSHAIGDSANRLMLNIYAGALKTKNDLRWRIEHVQVMNENDFHLFGDYSIIPSIQSTHATSDMYWAEERLGPLRIKSAYAYKQLMLQNNMIANGTDFPVEYINPLFSFYAAIARKDQKGFPEEGFQTKDSLSREEALKAMTIWAAYANFEENEKGSLEKDKFADFVVLEKDIMTIPFEETFITKVLMTYVGGERVY